MNVDLIRIEKSTDGVFGILRIDGQIFCCTLEPEDKGNQKGISCIPEGKYTCVRYSSPKFPNTFEITEVKDRDAILFHIGNVAKEDSRGCVLLGSNFGVIEGKRGITGSTVAFNNFMEKMKNERFFEISIFSA